MTKLKMRLLKASSPRRLFMAIAAYLLCACSELLHTPAPKAAWLLIPDSAQMTLAAQPNLTQCAIVLAPVAANPLLLSDEIWSVQSDYTLRAHNSARWALAPDQMTQTSMLAALSATHRYSAVLSQPQQNMPYEQLTLYLLKFWIDASAPTAKAEISWDVQLRCQNNTVVSARITQSQSFDTPKQMHVSMGIAFTRALEQTQKWLVAHEQTSCAQSSFGTDNNTRQ